MKLDQKDIGQLVEILGLKEEPFGVYYTETRPEEGFSPKPLDIPNREKEAAGEIDWQTIFGNFSCVIGNIWRARKKKTTAYFDSSQFGCPGGAFALGYLKPQTWTIIHYVSTGVPGQLEGECYLSSPQELDRVFAYMDPRPAPARWCVFKPLSLFQPGEEPELVVFFARPEVLAGLHQLAAFVTNDPEAVVSPWGAGCQNLVAWPFHYLAKGQSKAVLGGWDPSARKFYKTDELTLTVPLEMFSQMVGQWRDSFLSKEIWQLCRKKISRSDKAWGE